MEMNGKNCLRPLFWQHGEAHEILENEIEQMYKNGIGGFIVESRPHPDFMGEGWWSDLDFLIAAAKKRDMEVWLFDDSAYPSGYGAGKIKELYPQHLKVYLREYHIDAVGPLRDACFYITPWLKEGEELLAVTAVKRSDKVDGIVDESICDLTDLVADGRLYWSVPEGDYRIFLFVKTRYGGEEWTKDYVNPISREAAAAYISLAYESHYERYREEFGKTIKGFFIDEPRFGNAEGYERKLGSGGGYRECINEQGVVLPYSDEVFPMLSRELGEDCRKDLLYLWYGDSKKSRDVRYGYMDVITRLFRDGFIGQIGDWCRAHKVKLTGHVVEDNGAHARTGYGSGHFYRSLEGMDESGLDVVYQIWPERFEGRMESPFGYLDLTFYYWGLAKMASSFGHLDPKKEGKTMCEIFGAYGWQEGLKLMKWLTDHVCVRGVNRLVPHAFSPKENDEDCPPHFYAGGKNPQWKYFHIWSEYAGRVCSLLSDGVHQCPALVVYHAEAQWGGESQAFEEIAKALMEVQIDCDIAPMDYLMDREKTQIADRKLWIHDEHYEMLLMPYAQNITREWALRLMEFADQGVPVYLTGGYPEHIYYSIDEEILQRLKRHPGISVTDLREPRQLLEEIGAADVAVTPGSRYLRIYHYHRQETEMYFLTNESLYESISTEIKLPVQKTYYFYDALENRTYDAEGRFEKGETIICLELLPYQSLFLIGAAKEQETPVITEKRISQKHLMPLKADFQKWNVQLTDGLHRMKFAMETLANITGPDLYPEYAGDIVYTTKMTAADLPEKGRIFLELGEAFECVEVKLNGGVIGTKICPPYCYELTGLIQKENELVVTVTNTLSKSVQNNMFDRYMAQEPSGLLGPVRLLYSA